MSEFLVLKSTEEQKEEGVDQPVDTAFIEDRDGMPILKASFDVHHFKPDEVTVFLIRPSHPFINKPIIVCPSRLDDPACVKLSCCCTVS